MPTWFVGSVVAAKRVVCLVFLSFLLLSLFVFFSNYSPVLAAEAASTSGYLNHGFDGQTSPINLTLSPAALSIQAKPGEVIQAQIKIRNNSNNPEELAIQVGTFVADADGEKPKLLDPKPSDDFMAWLQVDQTPFVINPGEWKTVPIEFSPPSEAALAYYYTVIIHRTAEVKNQGGETVITGAPAVLILATVDSPNIKRELHLTSFTIKAPFLEFLPQEFDVEVKNTGNVHVAPTGNIFIDGQGKKDLAILTLNPSSGSILPDSTRHFINEWLDGFPILDHLAGDNNAKTHLKWDFNNAAHLRFGRYTAHLILVYDNGERDVPIESTVSFWVVPLRIIVGAIAVPVVPMVLVYLIMQRRLKKLQKQIEN